MPDSYRYILIYICSDTIHSIVCRHTLIVGIVIGITACRGQSKRQIVIGNQCIKLL